MSAKATRGLGGACAIAAIVIAGGCAHGERGPATRPEPAAAHLRSAETAPAETAPARDDAAVALADRVMERLGGRAAWDATRCIGWTFFGFRTHLWDKHTGDIRVEGRRRETDEPYVVAMNLRTGAGRAWIDGTEVVDPDRLAGLLDDARRAWINDSYWLVMPYKLRDPGVALRHLGPRAMADGREADVLELTFATGVGVTPENKYHVYVARDTGLVEQWDFFSTAEEPEPRFQIPWHDWKPYGAILLSGDRGQRRLDDIRVYDAPPRDLYAAP